MTVLVVTLDSIELSVLLFSSLNSFISNIGTVNEYTFVQNDQNRLEEVRYIVSESYNVL